MFIFTEEIKSNMVKTATSAGFITQIIGPVVDAEFPNGKLPKIYNAILEDRKLRKKLRRQKILLALTITTITGGLILWLIN